MTKITLKTSSCSLYVEGMDMACPLCKTMVHSGEQHECDGKRKSTKKLKAPKIIERTGDDSE